MKIRTKVKCMKGQYKGLIGYVTEVMSGGFIKVKYEGGK